MSQCRLYVFLLLLVATYVQAHQRDYSYNGNEHEGYSFVEVDEEVWDDEVCEVYTYYYDSDALCVNCFFDVTWEDYKPYFTNRNHHGIEFEHIAYFPAQTADECCDCRDKSFRFYSGYLHFLYRNDLPFLKKQIALSKKYPSIQLFWPERSVEAMEISDVAVPLFDNLMRSTALVKVCQRTDLSKQFMVRSWYFEKLSQRLMPKALCATCFHFSDYFQVCQDIKDFSRRYFNESECTEIEAKLDTILQILAPRFNDLYNAALSIADVPEFREELEVMGVLNNDWVMSIACCPACCPDGPQTVEGLFTCCRETDGPLITCDLVVEETWGCDDGDEPTTALALPKENTEPPIWCRAPLYLVRGITYNEQGMHQEAIRVLSEAIRLHPNCSSAYLERAYAYFETDQIDNALSDYWTIQKIWGRSPANGPKGFVSVVDSLQPLSPSDYAHGLCIGIAEGCYVSAEQFGPMLVSSTRGILHGLWCFACSPTDVSKEFVQHTLNLIQLIRSQACLDTLKMVVPELCELCEQWDDLSHYVRGRKMGYIIGKYGLDVFIPVAGTKLYNAYRALRAANTMHTLEGMAAGNVRLAKMLEESRAQAARKLAVIERMQISGKLPLKDPNAVTHIMQTKHLWDRAVPIGRDVNENCRRVLQYIEENNVVHPSNIHVPPKICYDNLGHPTAKVNRYDKAIGENAVRVYVEIPVEKGIPVIQNAFILKDRIVP